MELHTSKIQILMENMSRIIVGKDQILRYVVVSLLCEGHILLEDAPGLGKTKLALALAKSIAFEEVEGVKGYQRLQLTPDTLPSDIVGFYLFNQKIREFEYKEGVLNAHILLADEINRTSPKVQSSLLEAMEERQVTVDGVTQKLPRPFLVIATQNPLEHYGTYPLPDAQLDRFFMRLSMGHPTRDELMEIFNRFEVEDPIEELDAVLDEEALLVLQQAVQTVYVSLKVKEYILDIAAAIEADPLIETGVSPRGLLALLKASKGYALLMGRDYVLPDDVSAVAQPVLAHRLHLRQDAKWRNMVAKELVQRVLATVEVKEL